MSKKRKSKKTLCCEGDNTKPVFQGAKVALPVFRDEYTKECDRKTLLENKILSLVTIEIAVMTVFMPIIPFGDVKKLIFSNNNLVVIVTTIACMLLCIGIVMMAVSFGILMRAVNIQTYSKVDIEQLNLDENLMQVENAVEKGLCDHYKEITLVNSILNDKKADKYKKSFPLTIVSFGCLILGTVLLKIL